MNRKAKHARIRRLRPLVKRQAYAKDEARCIWPTCRIYVRFEVAQFHEVLWRGKGGDAADLDNVVTTCAGCHGKIHPRIGGVVKKMEGTRSTGLRFWERHGDDWTEVTRSPA